MGNWLVSRNRRCLRTSLHQQTAMIEQDFTKPINLDIIRQVRAEPGKIKKNEILTRYVNDPDIRAFLRIAYEPHVNFYILKVDPKLGKPGIADFEALTDQPFTQETLLAVYATLAKRKMTGNAAKEWLGKLYHSLDTDGKELLTLLIQRDVKAGISINSINKVWPGLITDVPYMRCSLPKDAKLAEWPWAQGIYSQIKADGMFANISHRVNGEVDIESRNGSPFPTVYFQKLIDEVKSIIPPGFQIHGELLMQDNDGQILPRQIGNGRFNSLLKEGLLEDDMTPVYQVWDIIPIKEAVVKNKFKSPYNLRFHTLLRCFFKENEPVETLYLKPIEYKMVFSLGEAYQHAKEVMELGLEGTVIKHPNAIWEDSTSKNQVKLKLEFSVDLLVVGFNAAADKSKNADTFGSMECWTLEGDLRVGVTGIPDDLRAKIWAERALWAGKKIIKVTANGVMMPSVKTNGYHSLFLPRFEEERLDKTVPDTLQQVLDQQKAAIEMMGNI